MKKSWKKWKKYDIYGTFINTPIKTEKFKKTFVNCRQVQHTKTAKRVTKVT